MIYWVSFWWRVFVWVERGETGFFWSLEVAVKREVQGVLYVGFLSEVMERVS